MSYADYLKARGFVRDYRDYLKKKQSSVFFCQNTVQPFCSQIGAQGDYLLYKTYQISCYTGSTVLYAKPPPQCASCKVLNTLYNGISIDSVGSEFEY
jgi:hypothetical protein